MSMVCPQCEEGFEQKLVCPKCGVRLGFQTGRRSVAPVAGPGENWQQTPWGRILAGFLLAQGMFCGLRQLTAGAVGALGGDAIEIWTTLGGLLLLQALQLLGLLIGGAIAGAGQRRGVGFGAIVGFVHGLLSLALYPADGLAQTAVTLYGQPMLHAGFGAFGGWIGSLIWKPLPELSLSFAKPDAPVVRLPSGGPSFLSGPVSIGRVLIGAVIVISGHLWANAILEWVLDASEGKLSISTHLQNQLVTWEITALAMLAGGAVAGASVPNSLKQGFCVGLITSAILVGILLGGKPTTNGNALLIPCSALALSFAGSWFGGQLFPPLQRSRRGRRFGPAI